MRVVLYGATGTIGSRILKELLSRGHVVTAVARDPSKLGPQNNLTIEKGDMLDADSIAKLVKGADVVVSSYGPPSGPQGPDPSKANQLSEAARALIAGVRRAGAPRIIMVGGAGSLEVSPGLQIVDAPNVPGHLQAGGSGASRCVPHFARKRFELDLLQPRHDDSTGRANRQVPAGQRRAGVGRQRQQLHFGRGLRHRFSGRSGAGPSHQAAVHNWLLSGGY